MGRDGVRDVLDRVEGDRPCEGRKLGRKKSSGGENMMESCVGTDRD